MQGIPSNNDFAHMPWFHYNSGKAAKADIGVTIRLADFLLKHADEGSSIYRKAEGLKERYWQSGKVLLYGYPDYAPEALNVKAYDPATYPSWLPLLVYFVASPESPFIRNAGAPWKGIWTQSWTRCLRYVNLSFLLPGILKYMSKIRHIRTAGGGAWPNRQLKTTIGAAILSYATWTF